MSEKHRNEMVCVPKRDTRPGTVHHLTSRIAHQVFILKEEERNDFTDIMLRVADFSGIRLIGWCIMTNHFHILAYLPVKPDWIGDEEVIRRWQHIAPIQGRYGVECDFGLWSRQGEYGQQMAADAIQRLKNRMYDISWFMKMVKQWFTERYNLSNRHVGTLWSASYYDRVIEELGSEAIDCLCYIHLNPIRAAITPDFYGYEWSSLCAAKKGSQVAESGLRMLYGDEAPLSDVLAMHHTRMSELLEVIKLQRAKEIALKLAAGIATPVDPLTNETLVAQQVEQLKEMELALADAHAKCRLEKNACERRAQLEKEIELLYKTRPDIRADEVAAIVERPCSTVYRIIKKLRSLGRIAA